MLGITDLGTYVIGTIAIILLPGPNSMYCLTVAGQYGAKPAYRAVAGIFLGDSVLMLLTALGAASIIKTIPALFWTLKILGGLYLAWIGLNLLRGAARKWFGRRSTFSQIMPEAAVEMPAAPPKHVFHHALTLSLLNPKAILFYLSFFVQFVNPHYAHPGLSFLLLATILQLFSMIYLSVLIYGGVSLVHWFGRYQSVAAAGMGAVGLMFVGFAAKLWTATAR